MTGAEDDPALDDLDRLLDGAMAGAWVRAAAREGTARAEAAPPLLCGRWRLLELLARGGTGAVWRGRDEHLARDVAIKILDPRHADRADLTQRFMEEAQIGGQLQHPGTVPVYEAGVDETGRPFFVMRLVRGRTLAEMLVSRSSPEDDRLRLLGILERACQTVAYAHDRGVVHRDLKPRNIMIGGFGEVQVVDWGFAKVLRDETPDAAAPGPRDETPVTTVRSEDEDSASIAGSIVGTPAYMAPEQARGETGADERADVFALGAILTEILTGAPPYEPGPQPEVLARAARADLAAAAARLDAAGADGDLAALAKSCLAAERASRPRDAGAVADGISRWLAGSEERARRAQIEAAEARGKAAEERRARRLGRALAAVTVVFAAGGVGVLWHLDSRRQEELKDTDRAIGDALGDAEDRASAGAFELADEAVRRARAFLATHRADPGAGVRVEAVAAAIAASRSDADRDAARRAWERGLVEALREARTEPFSTLAEVDEVFSGAFRAHDAPVDEAGGLPPERVAAADAEVRAQVASALDVWAARRKALTSSRRRGPPRRESDPEAAAEESGWRRLLAIAQALDHEPARTRLREAILDRDAESLRGLADGLDAAAMSAEGFVLLAETLREAGDAERRLAVLRRGYDAHPGDLWINHHLVDAYGGGFRSGPSGLEVAEAPGEKSDLALRHAWIAASVAPGSALAWERLGTLLLAMGMTGDARECARRATALPPARRSAVLLLARVSVREGDFAGAEQIIEDAGAGDGERTTNALVAHVAGRLTPEERIPFLRGFFDGGGHDGRLDGELLRALFLVGDLPAAVEFIDRETGEPRTSGHALLQAGALVELGRWSEAVTVLDRSSRRDSREARALRDEATAFAAHAAAPDGTNAAATGDPGARLFHARLALQQDRTAAAARLFAGIDPGRLAASMRSRRAGDATSERGPGPGGPERRAGGPGSGGGQGGGTGPGGPGGGGPGRRAPPEVSEIEVRSDLRDAAIAFARAGCGLGRDAGAVPAEVRPLHRAAALRCARAAVAELTPVEEGGESPFGPPMPSRSPRDRGSVARLESWRHDRRLAPVRDAAALALLPEDEQSAWRELWSRIEALLPRR